MGLEQLVGVEVVVPLEKRAPKDRRQHRCDEKLRELAQVRWPKLTLCDAAVDQASQRLDPMRDHMLEIEGSQFGMLGAFGDQEPRDGCAAREDKLLDEGEEWAFEEILRRHVGGLHLPADGIEVRRDDAPHHRLEQLFLGLEVEIGQALADAGARGDVLEPCRRVALSGEFLEGRGDDLLRTRVSPLAPLHYSPRCQSALGGFRLSHGVLPLKGEPRPTRANARLYND